jgi:antitoxin PrlF
MRAVERSSTITEKGQTTVPKAVRDALGVSYGGRIVFRVDKNGVSVRPADDDADDPVIDVFLRFLANDMQKRPRSIRPLTAPLARRIAELTRGSIADPDDEIAGPVEI